MAFQDLVTKAQTYFPDLQVKYKDQSTLMQWVGKLLFFNPSFMTSYLTTLGHTVYIPSEQYVKDNPQGTCDVFIHECTHMYDENRVGKLWYTLGYIFPQLLGPLFVVLMLAFGWKFFALFGLLFLAPLPAPWRAHFERRAYFVQMYVGNKLYNTDPGVDGMLYNSWFKDGSYYWMWPFGLDQEFAQEAINIKNGKSSVAAEPQLAAMVDDLAAAAKL